MGAKKAEDANADSNAGGGYALRSGSGTPKTDSKKSAPPKKKMSKKKYGDHTITELVKAR